MLWLSLALFGCAAVFGTANNPWQGSDWYVDQAYISEVDISIADYPNDAAAMRVSQNQSVAYWIDSMARIPNLTAVLDGAMDQYQRTNTPTLVPIVIYDVPDRDCAAAASNGEIVCQDSACTAGIQTYETQYITPIYNILSNTKYAPLRLVLIIEPDSLPNLATNTDLPKCAQAQTAYETCIAYAIKTFAQLSNVVQYVDAAHGGWLGWPNNMQKFVPIVKSVLEAAGGTNVVRGFASNTANYQPLGSLTSTADPCNLESQGNPCINEAIYIEKLNQAFENAGMGPYYYITDTSRNGVTNMRSDCSNWCNINGAGFGQRVGYANVQSITGSSIIDAFAWVKVPGESDGTSNTSAPNYDYHCGSQDSVIPAPQAGQWFTNFYDMLTQNAVPPLL